MKKREDLKVGDRIIAIYSEGYGNPGTGYEVEVTKITKDYITVKKVGPDGLGTAMDFTNDDRMCHRSLIYSSHQHCNLFLGTVEEAKAADNERVDSCELYLEMTNLLEEHGLNLKSATLKKIINLIKKEI